MLILETNTITNDTSTSFFFSDVTPLYNAVSAPGGYDTSGVTNFNPSDIDTSRVFIDVTLPDLSVVSFTVPGGDLNVGNVGTIGLFTYEISATDLGFSSTLEDGIYKFYYKIYSQDGSQTYSASSYIVVSFAICCCLESKLVDLTTCTNCSGTSHTKKLENLWNAWMLQSKLKHLVACHNLDGANVVFDYLSDYCNIKNCDSCN